MSHITLVWKIVLALLFVSLCKIADAQICYKWNGTCYSTIEVAERQMRSTNIQYELLKYASEDSTYIYYALKDIPEFTGTPWQAQHFTKYNGLTWGPLFAGYGEALAWAFQEAAQPSANFPNHILGDNMIFRGSQTISGKEYEYYSQNFPTIPISSVDITSTTYYGYCTQYTIGNPEAKVGGLYHFTYSSTEASPWEVRPDLRVLHFNGCNQGNGTSWRIQGLPVMQVRESSGSCPSGYTLSAGICTGSLTAQIEKVPGYVVEAPKSCPIADLTNPCSVTDGNKSEVQVDYASSADGGLEFARYYSSIGEHRTADPNAVGWRHTYSRELNEQPDKAPMVQALAPAGRSDVYSSASDACETGWDDIKDDAWGGDLSTATATFVGGNTCEISSGGAVKAYASVRSGTPWAHFSAPSTVKTITRPNGSVYRFVQDGSDWVNELDPRVTLEASGSNWLFTDLNDSIETYNSAGQLVSITTRAGKTTTLSYTLTTAQGGDDNNDTLDKVTGPFGHVMTFTYDGDARLESVTTPDGTISYGYDFYRNLTSVTYPDATGRQYVYDDHLLPSYLTGIIDENGDRYATWAYDDAGRAILSEHGNDVETVQLAYNSNGTTTLTLGNGASRTYSFDTERGQRVLSGVSGDVCSQCPDGDVASRTYDANGFVDETTDWNGNVTKTARNSLGLITTLTEAYGATEQRATTMTWHSTYRLPTEVSTSKNDTEYTYDANGNLTELTVTDGTDSRTWTMTYNAVGQVLTVNGPRTDVTDTTTFTYNSCSTGAGCGQVATITNALSQVTTFDSYDASGRLTQMTDANGLETEYTYNDRGNLLTVTEIPTVGSSRTTLFTYDDAGQVETVTLPSGLELNYAYNEAHYLMSVTDNTGNSIAYTYDAMGNVASEETYSSSMTLKRAMDYVYDLNGRLETATAANLYDTDFVFDDVGNLDSTTDAELAYTQHAYDALNRLEETIDALSGYTTYDYDVHDNLTSVSAPNGAVTDYTYDDLDNLTEEDSPDRGTITYTHDDAGNVITMTDARGKVTEYTYDALNRVTEIELDNSDTITFQYDTGTNAKGRLNKITDPSGETTWTYNNFGEVTSKSQKIGTITLTISYGYDTAGRLTSMTLPSGKVVTYGYSYDLPVSVTVDSTTILSGASYDPFGPVNGWTWGNSTSHSRTFDTRGLQTGQSMVTDSRTLTYDDVGRPITLDDSRHDLGFDYNALGQLTDFTAAGSAPLTAQDYTYDENGNRETLVQSSTTYNYSITAYTNRLASTTGPTAKTITYDAAGNITADGTHTYVYDDRGRLVSVNSGNVTYEHNGQDQRVKKDDGSSVTLYVYGEAGNLIGEYDESGNLIQEHVWFNGAPVAVLTSSDEYYVHTDHLGTPRIVSDGNTAIWRWESGPFGEEAAQEDPDNDMTDFVYNLRFPGQYYDDETGTHYNYYRTYDPSTGRYVESDPIGLDGSLNTYAYVGNMPTTYVDPFGLDYGVGVDPNAAGGNGHASLYYQGANRQWYRYDQGAAGNPNSSGGGKLAFLLGQQAQAGVGIVPVPRPPADALLYKSSRERDKAIEQCALRSQQSHNSGESKYDLYSNNCTDAIADVLSCADIWMINPGITPRPNDFFEKLKATPPRNKSLPATPFEPRTGK